MTTRVTFVISGLAIGGAEYALLNLMRRFPRERLAPSLVVLGRDETMAPQFRAAGVEPVIVGMNPRRPRLPEVLRAVRVIERLSPQLLQGWMHQGNVAASFLATRLRPRPRVCWSVRDTPDAAHRHSLLERAVLGAERWLSPSVDRVFNVSARSVGYCATTLHWDTSRTEVLPNGIDTTRFRPDLARRAQARQALGLAADAPVIAMVANFKPVKNFPLFMEAAGQLLAERRDARFLLIGRGVERANEELQALAARHGVADRLSLTGPRDDVEALLPAADVVALTSLSEGFPNVLAEALACGVPVTSTDVGDARDIVGPGGRILPAEAPAFASAWHELLRDERLRARLGSLGRSHIERAYALDTIAARLVGRYEALLAAGR